KEKGDAEMHLQIKKDLKQHVYLHIKEKYERDWIGHTGMERVLKHWEDQVNSQDIRWIDDNIKIVLLEMFEIQRDYLKELNKNPEINEELIRQQIHQIDLEEERIRYV
ncbi:MAG: Na+/H+ antiporter, partial [Bacilli bacterium]